MLLRIFAWLVLTNGVSIWHIERCFCRFNVVMVVVDRFVCGIVVGRRGIGLVFVVLCLFCSYHGRFSCGNFIGIGMMASRWHAFLLFIIIHRFRSSIIPRIGAFGVVAITVVVLVVVVLNVFVARVFLFLIAVIVLVFVVVVFRFLGPKPSHGFVLQLVSVCSDDALVLVLYPTQCMRWLCRYGDGCGRELLVLLPFIRMDK
mmetsp:Transcript_26753/g.74987  ORF Transcript_26753/g.74987 Transcript_26753/m.74987 type:complete len:202 (-) Transcript_26753:8-613(-)